ncbi:ArsR/SmtB family transcription factor [Bacillus solimangrovi]|uniref:Transcriptional regulator n=1 Tax=Bacillus solimangrovi TaxID=1305675 RepID=A0A1E5LK52_9BACI|nr:metalloregulator ArsR/SmtB family transcription factor [Bacillus solimangrovi]OEH94467.1 transcriptional regulator [Bacillus solimangrovi]
MEQQLVNTAQVLKLLGDKTRLAMVGLLLEDEFCVCEFVEIFQMSQPSISQHLRKLKDSGLIQEKRKKQWVIYSLNNQSEHYAMVKDILKYLPNQAEKVAELEKRGLRISCD